MQGNIFFYWLIKEWSKMKFQVSTKNFLSPIEVFDDSVKNLKVPTELDKDKKKNQTNILQVWTAHLGDTDMECFW